MIIPNKILSKWKLLRCQGDIKDISDKIKKSQPTITKAINKGEASEETFEGIKQFYAEREKQITA